MINYKFFIGFTIALIFSACAASSSSSCPVTQIDIALKFGNSDFYDVINTLGNKKQKIETALDLPNLTRYARSYGYRELANANLVSEDYNAALLNLEAAKRENGFTGSQRDDLNNYTDYVRKLIIASGSKQRSKSNSSPLIRIPPFMPPQADRSGHCQMSFDVDKNGNLHNITALYCTQDIFEEYSIRSMADWKYNPKIVNGEAVEQKNVSSKVSYRLLDECGILIPE